MPRRRSISAARAGPRPTRAGSEASMASVQQASRGRAGIVGINVTPMVDIVLVLLVIMMVSATYIVSQSMQVDLPKTATSDDNVASLAAVTLTKGREVFFNGERVDE